MPSFGEELGRERKLRRISLREVAEATKINLRYLEALERNDFTHLPGGLFNRGFVRAYCQYIGVDPEDMVNAYLLEERTQAVPGGTAAAGLLRGPAVRAEAEARAAEEIERRASRERRRRWTLVLVLAAALIAAGAFVVFWLLGGAGERTSPASSRSAPAVETGGGSAREGSGA